MTTFAVIMAGGRGTRFWPLSRKNSPKQFLSIGTKKSMIETTIERISPLIEREYIFVVATKDYEKRIKDLDIISDKNLIIEPSGKNTAPCIGLTAIYLKKIDPDGVMVVLPSDHIIKENKNFLKTIEKAIKLANKNEFLITLGIKPTRAETGYGYIEVDKGDEINGYKVIRFIEKPNKEKAENFIKSGNFFWNSGIFIWKISTILKELKKYLPDLYHELNRIEQDENIIEEVYNKIKAISIDKGVMEKSDKIHLFKADFFWSDVGDWRAASTFYPLDDAQNSGIGKRLSLNSNSCFVYSPSKLVALIGVHNLLIIESNNTILVCQKDKAQDVKKIVEKLEELNWEEYL
ncbi:MAG: mannose-1-phosphate guanylyltransferase [Deltaproteobacteria bacterium]|nr:mannose-1-phosphate guanylyltransferase [Deltaproteobacteria bacterium]